MENNISFAQKQGKNISKHKKKIVVIIVNYKLNYLTKNNGDSCIFSIFVNAWSPVFSNRYIKAMLNVCVCPCGGFCLNEGTNKKNVYLLCVIRFSPHLF